MSPAQTLLHCLHNRYACKAFDPSRRIPDDDFALILEAGRLAPSSFGFEPWRFLVIQNAALRDRINAVAWGVQRQMPGLSHLVVILARTKAGLRPDGPYLTETIMTGTQDLPPDVWKIRSEKFRSFLEDDFGIWKNERAVFEWACRQSYLALENMLLMATALGADSCPIEGFDKTALETVLTEADVLDKETFGVACMAAFGYRSGPPPREKKRRPIEDVAATVL